MKLLDQVRDVIRKRHYSIRTEQAYVQWIRRFIIFHGKKHPKDMGEKDISQYISYLATDKKVSSSTQNQALNAIVFLYKQVLKMDLGDFGPMERAKKPERLPTVLSKSEVTRLLAIMKGRYRLMAKRLYGCGLRLMECVRLRVKDIDFERNQITGPGWQRNERPNYNASGTAETASGRSSKEGKSPSPRGPQEGVGRSRFAFCFGKKIPERRKRMGVAVCFSIREGVERSQKPKNAAASHR